MTRPAACPALLIAAPASGQGKTTVTAALARLHARQSRRVRVFKCGPDFLDPIWLALASGHAVDNLDLWLNGETDIRSRLHEAARTSDLILIEGVMGLFDGDPSAADLAQRLGIPVLAVIDASAMAGTFGALAFGLRHYRPGLPWAGVLANRVASDGHMAMLQAALRPASHEETQGLPDSDWLGGLKRDAALALPERHLGLTVATELPDALEKLDALADLLECTPLGKWDEAPYSCWTVSFPPASSCAPAPLLKGRQVAVARDAAFCFIYPANLECLRALGAELLFFSPLADEPMPEAHALWLPGGYPELHAHALSGAGLCSESIRKHVALGKPVWAECGGMMPLFDALTLSDGTCHAMWGLLPGEVRMHKRLAALGPQRWDTPRGELRGHTFHYSVVESPLAAVGHTVPGRAHGRGEAIYQAGPVKASYFHAWFASNPEASAQLFLQEDS